MTGFGAMFFGGPEDGRREYTPRGPGGSVPPEIRIAGEPPELSATEAPSIEEACQPLPEGVYVATGRRGTDPNLQVRYEWRGWQ